MPHLLSSQYLYHFTPKLEYLAGILSKGFLYRELKEDVPLRGFKSDPLAQIPELVRHVFSWEAVCFCDIPENALFRHSQQYGEFGIALKKDWGISLGVTPIRYIHHFTPDIDNDVFHTIKSSLQWMAKSNRTFAEMLIQMLVDKGMIEKPTSDELLALPKAVRLLISTVNGEVEPIMRLPLMALGLSRAYQGKWFDRVSQKWVDRVFYDEKEWRSLKMKPTQPPLKFCIDDVMHIIVPNEISIDKLKLSLQKERKPMVTWKNAKQKIKLLNEITV